jgi:hypothetical protein
VPGNSEITVSITALSDAELIRILQYEDLDDGNSERSPKLQSSVACSVFCRGGAVRGPAHSRVRRWSKERLKARGLVRLELGGASLDVESPRPDAHDDEVRVH